MQTEPSIDESPSPLDTAPDVTARGGASGGFYAFAACLLSACITIALSELVFDNTLVLYYPHLLGGLAVAFLIVGCIHVLSRRYPARLVFSRALVVLWVIIGVTTLADVVYGWVHLGGYGDRVPMMEIIRTNRTFPRWLMGMAVLKWIHAGIWEMPTVERMMSANLASPEGFVEFWSTVAMAVATTSILWIWGRRRLSVILATLVPVWFMFGVGYVEYYPFIAWFFLLWLIYIFETPVRLENRSPYEVGIVTAAMPLAYIGFAPLSALMLAVYALRGPRDFFKAVGTAVLAGAIMIRVLYPGDVDVFLRDLYENMQFLDKWTYGRYVGHYIRPGSNFFAPGYALSPDHLRDLLFMYVFGGGVAFPLMLAALALWRRPRKMRRWRIAMRDSRTATAVALVLWQAFYMLFYVARLGPQEDIDLFFSTFVVMAFFAGYLADRAIRSSAMDERATSLIAAWALGGTSIAVIYLLDVGMPVV